MISNILVQITVLFPNNCNRIENEWEVVVCMRSTFYVNVTDIQRSEEFHLFSDH